MSKAIDFYFDFSSPYGYLAAQRAEAMGQGAGRPVIWKPFLLGALFKQEGSKPLIDYPLKGAYSLHDMRRAARRLAVPFTMPEPFPFSSVAAARAFYALTDARPADAKSLALALFAAIFGRGQALSDASAVLGIAADLGLDAAALGQAMTAPEVKARLRQEVEGAMARGVFGSPFFIVDGEAFWGHDRMAEVEDWAKTGGW
jgi:2-hydroxychromene-2-carboxylate isomerase